ncbi:MFS transporter [Xenorhabdus griffiniae]|uniref:MFS transporter n=1 Tax=Xenorhabdus griffiniae TaxID=351672 RepID=A0ABY9XJ71_9GAMM|nr:MFS transporter [Xenorhabdus griffiniae]MBD1227189.1 MFS transporter [Xenorhabdus griffiniae]MBE8589040.1 MFS transporter [Xenorhabdus griffiniae]WMV72880.1 MFS transporter [Xenorhabdus griffiniae]WNH02559.1 MFS transporter [Xenorhabdus griffiniae]
MTSKIKSPEMPFRTWLALFILAISTFTIVTTELAPVGLLTPIADGLNTSESSIGMTVSLYAWGGALSALLASVFLGNFPKKILLLTLTIILAVSNILSATIDSFEVLLVARVIGSVAHGAFWAMIGATTVAMVPIKYLGTATSIVFGGVSAASVLGIPLSNYIGLHFGWRQAFWLMALLSVVAFFGIMLLVPKVTTKSTIGINALKSVLSSAIQWKIYAATLLAITAHFAAFTFIEPWLNAQPIFSKDFIPTILFIYGIAGLGGNFLTGIVIDKHLKTTVTLSALLIGVVLLILGIRAESLSRTDILIAIALWGVAISGIFVGFQTWVLRLAGDKTFPASAVYVSFFNGAIGMGALVGAWMVSALSLHALFVTAGAVIALSILIISTIPSNISTSNTLTEKVI